MSMDSTEVKPGQFADYRYNNSKKGRARTRRYQKAQSDAHPKCSICGGSIRTTSKVSMALGIHQKCDIALWNRVYRQMKKEGTL